MQPVSNACNAPPTVYRNIKAVADRLTGFRNQKLELKPSNLHFNGSVYMLSCPMVKKNQQQRSAKMSDAVIVYATYLKSFGSGSQLSNALEWVDK